MKYAYEALDARGDDWIAIAENSGNPWHYPFQPRVPGLELTVTTNWDQFNIVDDAEEQFRETISERIRGAARQIQENRSARKKRNLEKKAPSSP